MHPGSFSATSESLTASGCSPLRIGMDSQECCATLRVSIRPRYDAFIAAGGSQVRFLTNLIQVYNWARSRY